VFEDGKLVTNRHVLKRARGSLREPRMVDRIEATQLLAEVANETCDLKLKGKVSRFFDSPAIP